MLNPVIGMMVIGSLFLFGCTEKKGALTTETPPSIGIPDSGSPDSSLIKVGKVEKIETSPVPGILLDSNKGWLQLQTSSSQAVTDVQIAGKTLVSLKTDKDNNGNSGGSAENSNENSGPEKDFVVSAINILVSEVSVRKQNTDEWILVSNQSRSINLLALNNDAKAFFANNPLQPGAYDQIRIKIDKTATALVDEKTVPLHVPSGATSGIKMKGLFTVQKGYLTKIHFEVDGKKSVIRKKKNHYTLRPVIRIEGVSEDLFPPLIAFGSPESQSTNIAAQNIELEYSDDFLNLSTLSIRIDGVESKSLFTISDEGATGQKVFSEGTHKIEAKISDQPGHLGIADPIILTVDLTGPTLSFLQDGYILGTKNPTIEIRAMDNLTGVVPTSVKILIDNVDVTSRFSVNNDTWSGLLSNLSEGAHSLSISGQDLVGNSSLKSGSFFIDVTPPRLTQVLPQQNKKIFTRTFPKNVNVQLSTDEKISVASVNGAPLGLNDDTSASGVISVSSSGVVQALFKAKDLAGNEGILESNFEVELDQTAPVITFGLANNIKTKNFNIDLPITITDQANAWSKISVNGIEIMQTGSKSFNFQVGLLEEGANSVSVVTEDEAGNTSQAQVITIIRDSLGPQLTNLVPTNGSRIFAVMFPVSGASNEALLSISINGLELTLDAARTGFSGTYVATGTGHQDFIWIARDELGNETQVYTTAEIDTKLMNPDLISVGPNSDGTRLLVSGRPGAVRPSVNVKADTGFFSFNRGETTSNEDGSFNIELDFFTNGTLTVKDLATNEEETTPLHFVINTRLTGIVKDTDNNPLPGATVRIVGSTQSTVTNEFGIFSFSDAVSGDQTVEIDGTTIPQTVTGPTRKFSKTNLVVSLIVAQNNSLQRPVYLTPLYLDGSETSVVANAAAIVESPQAPGVQLDIPANSTMFPDGSASGKINIASIQSDRSTIEVPQAAVPTKVIALEPSGLSFTQRIPITLPNDNELPAGVEILILSMNSKKGIWEVDGVSEVSGDGRSIVSKDGQGISHFSLVYAVPLKPLITEVANPNLLGVDASQGAMSTTVEMPSFRALGQKITPKMVYKSSWANPTAVVSNIFDIPTMKATVNFDKSFTASSIYWEYKCFLVFCDEKTYHIDYERNYKGTSTSWYQPDSIRSQFFVGPIASNQVNYVDSENVPTNRELLPGPIFNNSMPTQVVTNTGIPNRSLISYSVSLKDPVTGEFLKSGIYPTLARYEIRLKNMVITTTTTTDTTRVNGEIHEVRASQPETKEEVRLLKQALPQDVVSSLLVQNKNSSPFGRGWHFAAAQRIINPENNRILIEEESGEVSTYSINDTISTIFSSNNVDYNSAMDLSQYPKLLALSSFELPIFNVTGKRGVLRYIINPAVPNQANLNFAGMINNSTGLILNQGYQDCGTQNTFKDSQFLYGARTTLGGIVETADGTIYGLDSREHSLFSVANNTFSKIGGRISHIDQFGNFFLPFSLGVKAWTYNGSQMVSACTNLFGKTCVQGVVGPLRNCNDYCYPGRSSCSMPPQLERVGASTGEMGTSGYGNDGYWDQPRRTCSGFFCNTTYPSALAFNNPGQMVISPDGKIVYVDTGNSIVRKLDLVSRNTVTIAGGGNGYDPDFMYQSGFVHNENIRATRAALSHPKGIVFDSFGNYYLSEDNGKIRRVGVEGLIATIAGLPLTQGGILTDEGPAKTFAFNDPRGLALDEQNNFLYVADTGSHRVIRINLTTNIASTVAGNGTCNPNEIPADGLAALSSSICSPTQISLDSDKNLIIVDSGHRRIRRVSFTNSLGGLASFSPSAKDMSILTRNPDGSWQRTYRDGTKVNFNSSGLQTSLIDRAGRTTSYAYTGDGQISQITDTAGQITTVQYGGNLVTGIIDPAGRTTSYSYSGNLLKKITFPDGSAKRFEYDSQGLLVKEFNERGFDRTYTYNGYNRVTLIKDFDGTVSSAEDQGSASVDKGTLHSYGADDNLVHDKYVDTKGNESRLVKDYQGFIKSFKDASGQEVQILRNAKGQIESVIYADGSSEQYSYDPNTQDLIKTLDVQTGIATEKNYNSFGQVLTEKDGRGLITSFVYDSVKGLLIRKIEPGNKITEFTYNHLGLVETKKIYPDGTTAFTTTYQYDAKGNLIKQISNDGKEGILTYDLAGNVISSTQKQSSTLQATTLYVYDQVGRLVKVTSPKNEVTEYFYSPSGQLVSIKDPQNKEVTFEYDSKDRVIKKTDQFGLSYEFTYDSNGNLLSEKDPKGQVKTYAYDDLNQLTQVSLPDDQIFYAYNVKREIIWAENSTSQIVYTRNSKNWVTSSAVAGSGTMSNYPQVQMNYTYDENGNRTQLDTAFGSLGYSYDASNRLTSLANSWGHSFGFSYDQANRLIQITRPGSSSTFSFTAGGAIASIQHLQGSTVKSFVDYSYDLRNYPIQKRTLAGDFNYGYDPNGQLTSVSGLQSENFTYDTLGNRVTDGNGNYFYDSTSQRLTEDWQYTYQYDLNGNLISKIPKNQSAKAYQYIYSSKNQLIQVRVLASALGTAEKDIFFTYDVLGRRMEKKVVDVVNSAQSYSRRYVYDRDNIIAEYDGNNSLLAKYTHSPLTADDILSANFTADAVSAGLSSATGSVYYLKDALGSITDIVNSSGSVVQSYQYSGFGNLVSIKNGSGMDVTANAPVKTSFMFTGREFDQESGLYYYRARYYDPGIGRFLQVDPDPGRIYNTSTLLSKYTYVGNNPIMRIDPSGKSWLGNLVVGAIAFAAAFVLAPVVAAAIVGATAGAAYFAVAAISGALIGGVVGGITNVAIGNGTFNSGFRQGMLSGLLGGLSGAYSVANHAAAGASGSTSGSGALQQPPGGRLIAGDSLVPYDQSYSYPFSPPVMGSPGVPAYGDFMLPSPIQWREVLVPWPSPQVPIQWETGIINTIML